MIWNCDHFSKLNAKLHILENSYIFNNDQNKTCDVLQKNYMYLIICYEKNHSKKIMFFLRQNYYKMAKNPLI